MKKQDKLYYTAIVGSGPAGLFAAMEFVKAGKGNVIIIDMEPYPSGGLLNDCKLNLTPDIGMDIDELYIDRKTAETYIEHIDKVFLDYGANPDLYGVNPDMYREWVERAKRNDAELIPAKQRHIGTDMSKHVIAGMRKYLEKNGIEIFLGCRVEQIAKDGHFTLQTDKGDISAEHVILAPGRSGSKWLRDVSKKLGINYSNGKRIDVGIRVEMKRSSYPVTDVIYDPKFKMKSKYGTMVRTFCTNPGGRVRIENYDQFRLVNGDALKNKKTANTNFALLETVELTEPLTDPFVFGRLIASATNILGDGKPIIQRIGDFLDEKRSKMNTFFDNNRWFDKLTPTLKPGVLVTPGDIRMAYPYKTVKSLKEALIRLNKIFDNTILKEENIIYAPEIKFYSLFYDTDNRLQTNVKGIFVAGDGAGKSRGIVGAAISGMIAAKGVMHENS